MKAANINFFDNIEGITAKEHSYWRSHFEKILKVGVELEFNLKLVRGDCKGYNTNCVCEFYNECSPIPCLMCDDDGNCTLYYDTANNCEHADDEDCTGICHTCIHARHMKCDTSNCISYQPVCLECANTTINCAMCKEYVKNRIDPSTVRRKLAMDLQATNNFGVVGDTGVLQVVGDGSLENKGLEIPTVGRRYDFYTFRDMFKTIIDKATEIGGYLNSRCSIHTHILNDYYTKLSNDNGRHRHPDDNAHMNITSLEREYPNIILYNILQIWRKYEAALFWMSMGLGDADHMTRWSKFRYPLRGVNPMYGFKDMLSAVYGAVGNSKYGALNIKNCLFKGERLHLEFRTMDFVKSPTYISAMCALYQAIVMKAIDISVFGVMDIDSNVDVTQELEYVSMIANGYDKGYDSDRLSDTSNVLRHRDYYVSKGHEMLDFLTSVIDNVSPEMAVLRAIVDSPPALYFIASSVKDPQNNYDIEAEYAKYLPDNTSTVQDYICKVAALGNIHSCKSRKDWIREVYEEYANALIPSQTQLSKYVNEMVERGILVWDFKLQAFRQRI